jgi:hypothetical protein
VVRPEQTDQQTNQGSELASADRVPFACARAAIGRRAQWMATSWDQENCDERLLCELRGQADALGL